MKCKDSGITNINDGCIDYYYSLQIKTKLNFDNLCKCIKNKINSTLEEYNSEITAILKNDIKHNFSKKDLKKINVNINNKDKLKNSKKFNLNSQTQKVLKIELEETDKELKIYPISEFTDKMEKMNEKAVKNYYFYKKIYGESFIYNVGRFVLPTYKVQLMNNIEVFIEPVLFVFKNEMMILRISIPIQKVKIIPLFENNIDKYISNFIDVYDIGKGTKVNNIEELSEIYCKYIYSSSKKIKFIQKLSKCLENIILANFDGMPSNVKEISEDIEEALYRVIVAPIQRIDNISFKDVAKEYMKNNSTNYNGIKYITSSMGKCLSIIDTNTIRYIKKNVCCKDKNEEIYEQAIDTIRMNVEFALLIIALKNMNNIISHLRKKIDNMNFYEIQKEYNYNSLFILQLQESCFGSVREQISWFENNMKYFLDSNNVKEKNNAINSIIENEINTRNDKFQNFLSVGSFFITIIFGLQAIYEALTIIRKSNIFINRDIPIVTIENCSIGVWIILTCILFWAVFFQKRKFRRKINIKNRQ